MDCLGPPDGLPRAPGWTAWGPRMDCLGPPGGLPGAPGWTAWGPRMDCLGPPDGLPGAPGWTAWGPRMDCLGPPDGLPGAPGWTAWGPRMDCLGPPDGLPGAPGWTAWGPRMDCLGPPDGLPGAPGWTAWGPRRDCLGPPDGLPGAPGWTAWGPRMDCLGPPDGRGRIAVMCPSSGGLAVGGMGRPGEGTHPIPVGSVAPPRMWSVPHSPRGSPAGGGLQLRTVARSSRRLTRPGALRPPGPVPRLSRSSCVQRCVALPSPSFCAAAVLRPPIGRPPPKAVACAPGTGPLPHASVRPMEAERAARRAAKRQEKAEKKAAREATRLRNSLRCDERAHVRIAASLALQGRGAEGGPASPAAPGDADGAPPPTPVAVSRCGLGLREFSLELLPSAWGSVTSLDLSHNKLTELPGLERLAGLTALDLCRNEFRALPPALRALPRLATLNASRNHLRPNAAFLVLLLQPPGLPALQDLDLTFNKKVFKQDLKDTLAAGLPQVAVRMTVTFPPPPGAYVGDAACDRDAALLRSQLEPYTTLALRERLATTFGRGRHSMVGPPPQARAEVMEQLLECYAAAGVPNERRLVCVGGCGCGGAGVHLTPQRQPRGVGGWGLLDPPPSDPPPRPIEVIQPNFSRGLRPIERFLWRLRRKSVQAKQCSLALCPPLLQDQDRPGGGGGWHKALVVGSVGLWRRLLAPRL